MSNFFGTTKGQPQKPFNPVPGRGQNLSALFPAAVPSKASNVSAEVLPPGYIVEYGAQLTQRLQGWHQGLVDGALANAKATPIFVFLLPASGYVG